MDPDELIRALVSVGLVVTMSLGANCQGAAGSDKPEALNDTHRTAPVHQPTQPAPTRG